VYWIRALGLSQIRDSLVRIGWGFGAILAFSGVREALRALAWTQAVEGAARLPFRDAFAARLAGGTIHNPPPLGRPVGAPGHGKTGGTPSVVPRGLSCADDRIRVLRGVAAAVVRRRNDDARPGNRNAGAARVRDGVYAEGAGPGRARARVRQLAQTPYVDDRR